MITINLMPGLVGVGRGNKSARIAHADPEASAAMFLAYLRRSKENLQ